MRVAFLLMQDVKQGRNLRHHRPYLEEPLVPGRCEEGSQVW